MFSRSDMMSTFRFSVGVRGILNKGKQRIQRIMGERKHLIYNIFLGFNAILLVTIISLVILFLKAAPKPLSLVDNYTQWAAPALYISTYLVWPGLQISAERRREREKSREEERIREQGGNQGTEIPTYDPGPAWFRDDTTFGISAFRS